MLLDMAVVIPVGNTPGSYLVIEPFCTLEVAREMLRWIKGAIVVPRKAL